MIRVIIAIAASPTSEGVVGWGAVLLALKDGYEVSRLILSGTATTVPEGLLRATLAGLERLKRPVPVTVVYDDDDDDDAPDNKSIIDAIRTYPLAIGERKEAYNALLLAKAVAARMA